MQTLVDDALLYPSHCTVKAARFFAGVPSTVVVDNVRSISIDYDYDSKYINELPFTVHAQTGGTCIVDFLNSSAPSSFVEVNSWDVIRIEAGKLNESTYIFDEYLYGCTKLGESVNVSQVKNGGWLLNGRLVFSFIRTEQMQSSPFSNSNRNYYFKK